MEKILKKLSEMILEEMRRKNQSCLQFAELCGVGRNIVGDIINGKKKDVKLSTIVKICENSDININDVFPLEHRDCFINDLNLFLICEKKTFKITLEKIK